MYGARLQFDQEILTEIADLLFTVVERRAGLGIDLIFAGPQFLANL